MMSRALHLASILVLATLPASLLGQAITDFPCATNCTSILPDESKGVTTVVTSTTTVPSNPCPGLPNVTGAGLVYHITHSWSGDLVVKLTHPNGTTVHTLATGAGAWTDDLGGTLSNITTFDGLPRAGTWTLSMEDLTHTGIGALDSWTLILYCKAEVSVTNVDSPDPATAGAQITYTVTGTNSGPADSWDLGLTDPLPAGTSFVSASASSGGSVTSAPAVGATSGNVAASWPGPTPVGGSRTLTVTVKLCPEQACNSTVGSAATISFATPPTDTTSSNNTATATTTVKSASDLSVTQTAGPDPVAPGGQVTYNVTVANAGPSSASAPQVTETLPAGWLVVSATPSTGSCSGVGTGTATCLLSNLAASGSCVAGASTATIAIVASVPGGATFGTYQASASVTSANCLADPVPANDAVTTGVQVCVSAGACTADLSITKSDTPDPVIAGENVTYTLTATNNGPASAQDVAIGDTIPASTRFVSASASGGGSVTGAPAVGGSGTVLASWPGLTANAATRTLTIVVKSCSDLTCASSIGNTASVVGAATPPDPLSTNNTATSATAVQARSDLALTLTAPPGAVGPGGQVTYTLGVSNAGPSGAAGTSVVETLPAGFTVASAVSSQGTCSGTGTGTATCAVGSLASGGTCTGGASSATITVVANVPAGAASGTHTATATVSTTNCLADPTPANNSASVDVTVSACVTDTNPPVVTPPAPVTVNQTTCSGALLGATLDRLPVRLADQFTLLESFVNGSTASDACSVATKLTAQLDGSDVTSTTLFLVGATNTVTFRWKDAANNVGSATSTVVVRREGDVNLDGTVDVFDVVTIQNYIVGNVQPGVAPFLAPASLGWCDADTDVDVFDVVVLQGFIVGNVSCLTP